MSVRIRPYRRGGWEVDIQVVTPDGKRTLRERRRAKIASRTAAMRWAEGRERVLFDRLMNPAQDPTPKQEVPTLQAFAPRFIEGHARANRLKPSGIASKTAILRLYLIPAFGRRRLDAIKSEDVQRLKAQLEVKSPKTVNNVLTVLNVLLKKAVEWEVIERMPCTVKLLRVDKGKAAFHDVYDYERLVDVARAIDRRTLLIVLLGGDAGLRCGEMIALEWGDVDLAKRQLCVRQSDWNGQVGTPKSGRLRYLPLTERLAAALAEHRHLRSKRVLCQDDGKPFTRQIVQNRMILAAKRAKVRKGIHILRHTFCSLLAMRGAPARAIQELAGHADLTMTQRYMHLSPAALADAIRLLDRPGAKQKFGRGGDGVPDVKTINKSGIKTGGEAGIRTLDTAFGPYNGLANRRLQPLGHLTANAKCNGNQHFVDRNFTFAVIGGGDGFLDRRFL
jgi:integrase